MFDMLSALPENHLNKLLFSVGAILIAYILSSAFKKSMDLIVSGFGKRISHEAFLARTRTIKSLLRNLIDVMVFAIVLLVILAHWEINIMPILTGAGIAGLAISFGAQTLVKDVISGFFIILEDQFSVGDKVKIEKHEGIVERVTLRLTVLKDKNGHLIYIPNSQITTVVRYDSKPRIATLRSN
jgi:small-conductance mechanosensitive channel